MLEKILPKGWRTVIANILMSLPAIWDVIIQVLTNFVPLAQEYGLKQVIPDSWMPYYVAGMVLINIYLRTITTTKIGQKE